MEDKLQKAVSEIGKFYGTYSRDAFYDDMQKAEELSDFLKEETTIDFADWVLSVIMSKGSHIRSPGIQDILTLLQMNGASDKDLWTTWEGRTQAEQDALASEILKRFCITFENYYGYVGGPAEDFKGTPGMMFYNQPEFDALLGGAPGFKQGKTRVNPEDRKVVTADPKFDAASLGMAMARPSGDFASQYDIGVQNSNTYPNAGEPGTVMTSVIQVFDSAKTFTTRGAGASTVFMNLIPTVEMSRCIPFFDMTIITSGGPMENAGQTNVLRGVTLARAILGEQEVSTGPDNPTFILAGAQDIEAAARQVAAGEDVEAGGGGEGTPAVVPAWSGAGMELFTTPQTMVPLNQQFKYTTPTESGDEFLPLSTNDPAGHPAENIPAGTAPRKTAVLDPFRPIASVESFTCQAGPKWGGGLSYKSASLNLVIHDRSRLAELAPLLRPDIYGKGLVKVVIKYGWSHPQGQPGPDYSTQNSYAQLLNAGRQVDVYIVSNVKMTMDQTGQVKLAISLVVSGGASTNNLDITEWELADGSGPVTLKMLENISKAIVKVRSRSKGQQPTSLSVAGASFLNSFSSVQGMLTADKAVFVLAKKYIAMIKDAEQGSLQHELLVELRKLLPSGKSTTTIKARYDASIASALGDRIDILKKSPDPFLRDLKDGTGDGRRGNIYISPPVDTELSGWKVKGKRKVQDQPWVSLGKLISVFVGQSLKFSGAFSEIQFIYYPINSKASFVRGWNLANFPIKIDDFKEFYLTYRKKAGPRMTLQQFMDFMRRYFVSNQGSIAYGLAGKKTGVMTKSSSGYQKKKGMSSQTLVDDRVKRVLDQAYNSEVNPQAPTDDDTAGQGYRKPTESLVFRLPSLSFLIETTPREEGLFEFPLNWGVMDAPIAEEGLTGNQAPMVKIHIYDAANSSSYGQQEMLHACSNASSGFVGSDDNPRTDAVLEKALSMGIIREAPPKIQAGDGEDTYTPTQYLPGGFGAVKKFVGMSMPNITPGSNNSQVMSCNYQSLTSGLMATISIQRSLTNSAASAPTDEAAANKPMKMLPFKIGLSTAGNPFFEFGQEYFVDLKTGTTMDNIYMITKLTDSISPGKYTTTVEMTNVRDAYGSVESFYDKVVDGIKQLEIAEAMHDEEGPVV